MTVGRKVCVLKDESRIDPISKELREVLISIYYPSNPVEHESKYISLFEPNISSAVDMLSSMGVDKDYICNLDSKIHNDESVDITAKTCPIIFVAPAFGVVRDMYSFCVEHLVECGFVVITIGATHESIFSIFPDGRFVNQSNEVSEIESLDIHSWKQLLKLRVEDISWVLENIAEVLDSDKDLRGIVDVNEMGIIGHSLGGAAAYELLKREKRIKASILLDPSFHLMTTSMEEGVSVPLLVARQEKCSFEELENEISPDLLPLLLSGYESLFNSSDLNSSFIKLNGTHHMTFSDIPIHYNEDGIQHKHSTINKYISAFLEEHLKKEKNKFHKLLKNKINDGIDQVNSKGHVI
ncbi:hypothetical protein [Paenibacillus sp. BIC5C1]|uniref:alpha/beta hydrolase n=1 Tax=Paenibacillus TaxID=44249 RepID=UPI0028EF3825|nr:hypothetical protein [Paenibacillus sp. BIC5C1]